MTEPFVARTGQDVLCHVARLDGLDDSVAWAVSGNLLVEEGLLTQPRDVRSGEAELQHYRSSSPRPGRGHQA